MHHRTSPHLAVLILILTTAVSSETPRSIDTFELAPETFKQYGKHYCITSCLEFALSNLKNLLICCRSTLKGGGRDDGLDKYLSLPMKVSDWVCLFHIFCVRPEVPQKTREEFKHTWFRLAVLTYSPRPCSPYRDRRTKPMGNMPFLDTRMQNKIETYMRGYIW